MPACSKCSSCRTVKNGRIHNGKQRLLCHECSWQFVEHRKKKALDTATRELVDRLLLERISLAGIARVAQVSEQWLQTYVHELYAAVLPSPMPRAVGNQIGKTSYVERFNNILRQRGSRLVRKTLSFSKSRLES